MEHLEHTFDGSGGSCHARRDMVLVGVVASGNLEVMMERADLGGKCEFVVDTAARGFADSWRAVLSDFMARHSPADLRVSINDNAASPAVVAMRLDQAYEEMTMGEGGK